MGMEPETLLFDALIPSLEEVGARFERGDWFVPEMLIAGKAMAGALEVLRPLLAAKGTETIGKFVMGTVKGDVHDIGKNIVGVVLGCNNYEVIDLGVMVPSDKIIKAAIEHNVSIVGLSGLITPSLDEMVHVAREMQRNGLKLPLLIGGATTSKIHTAVKIAQHYDSPVVHVLDASRAVGVVSKLLSQENRAEFEASVRADHETARQQHAGRVQKLITVTEARERRFDFE